MRVAKRPLGVAHSRVLDERLDIVDAVRRQKKSLSGSLWSPFRHRPCAIIWTATLVSNIGGWMYTKPVAIVPSEVEFAPRGWFEGLRITGAAIRTPSLAAKAIPFHVARELVANFSCSLPGHPECHFALCQPFVGEILSLLREVVTGRIHVISLC